MEAGMVWPMLAGSGHRHERFSQAGAALLVEVADVFALVVIELLKTQGVFVEIGEQVVDAGFHVDGDRRDDLGGTGLCCRNLRSLLLQQQGNAALERFQPLTAPGIEQVDGNA